LILHLKKIGLSATGTVRQNRVKINVDLPKKCDRGTTTSVHDKSSKINYVTVMDSKPVSILSTDYGDENKVTMSRYVDKEKKKIEFPVCFSKCNKHMGGINLHD